MSHIPVLKDEVVALFAKRSLRTFFDGTIGAGGHAKALLSTHPELNAYIGCDRDLGVLQATKQALAPFQDKLHLFHGSHSEVRSFLRDVGVSCTDGLLIDAGVSSMQLDRQERGFSFQADGPLDMRMDQEASLTAEQIVNRWPESELVRILREYGEEPRARAIARAILAARKKKPIRTTHQLCDAIRPVARGKKHLHPATLTFQALRIAVNDELNALQQGVSEGIHALCPHGCIAVISFHRLEDRIVKQALRQEQLHLVTKKPIGPTEEEIKHNPRSRSAKLRAAEKE